MITQKQNEVLESFRQHKSVARVAEELGIGETSVIKSLGRCAINMGVFDEDYSNPCQLAGFQTKATSSLIKHAPNDEGRVMTWYKDVVSQDYIDTIIEALQDRIPVNTSHFQATEEINFDTMLEILIADPHIGALCWKAETHDSDYDLKIATDLYLRAISETIRRSGVVGEIRLKLLGDITHTNGIKALTPGHGHVLDADSRYPKILATTIDILCSVCEICANACSKLKVMVIQGNHDESSAFGLQHVLNAYFRNNDNIEIDMSPAKMRFDIFGLSAFGNAHGDQTKTERLAMDLMTWVARNDHRGLRDFYIRQGHKHTEEKRDVGGVLCETYPTIFPKDAFAGGGNWSSKRSLISNVFDREKGLINSYIVTPRQIGL